MNKHTFLLLYKSTLPSIISLLNYINWKPVLFKSSITVSYKMFIKTSFSLFEWRTQAKKGHRTNGGQVLIGMPPDIFDHISDFWDNSTIHLSPLQLLLCQCHLCSNRKKKYNLRIFTNVFFRFFGKLGLKKKMSW